MRDKFCHKQYERFVRDKFSHKRLKNLMIFLCLWPILSFTNLWENYNPSQIMKKIYIKIFNLLSIFSDKIYIFVVDIFRHSLRHIMKSLDKILGRQFLWRKLCSSQILSQIIFICLLRNWSLTDNIFSISDTLAYNKKIAT